MAQNKKPATKTAAKKAPAKKAAAKKAPAKKATVKKSAPKKEKDAADLVADIAADYIDREQLADLVKKVDDAIDQEKIESAIDDAKEIVEEAVAKAEKKISWLKKIFGKKK